MGSLLDQDILTFFHGVSRQPDTVRLPGQVQEADNVLCSVVTGGFSDRSGTKHIAALADIGADERIGIHGYRRDEVESYIIVFRNGSVAVYDALTGAPKTVNVHEDVDLAYLTTDTPDLDMLGITIADYTLIANRTVTVAMQGAGEGEIFGPVKSYNQLPRKGETVPEYLKPLAAGSAWADTDDGCADGSIWKVEPTDGDKLGYYFVKLDRSGTIYSYEETADPNHDNDFDPDTMPLQLVREADGTFTLSRVDWASREVGDPEVVPDPDFVGQTISDLIFFRDRLTVVSGENVYPGQSGDYFNFWPDKSTDVLDSDPFGRTATSGNASSVNILRFAVPFRKVMFTTSEAAQFELSASQNALLTPRTASFEEATTFSASPRCRPFALGDQLYLAAQSDDHAAVLEYFFNNESVGNSASDVTKHCQGYVPDPVIAFSGHAVSGALVALSSSERNSLYVYRLYWQDEDTKSQSSWSRWKFGETEDDAYLHGMITLGQSLYLIVRRAGVTFMETLSYGAEFDDPTSPYLITDGVRDIRWPARLDRRTLVTGTYNSSTERTTWTLPYEHGDLAQVVLTDDFARRGTRLSVTYPTPTTVAATGDHSGGRAIVGVPYRRRVKLSKLYIREQDGKAITTGRTALRTLDLNYQNSGYFTVTVTARARAAKTWTFTGRILGDAANIIGSVPISESGVFRVRPDSNASTVDIVIESDSYVPFTITSAAWAAFFNSISRQER